MTRTKKEVAQSLRACDLLTIPMRDLGTLCQSFGTSGRGTREELIERLHRALWRKEFDEPDGAWHKDRFAKTVSWTKLNEQRHT